MRIKLKSPSRFLAAIFGGIGTSVRKDGLATYIDLDYSEFGQVVYDPTTQIILTQSTLDGSFSIVTIAGMVADSQSKRVITEAGDVNIAATDGLIILKKDVAEDTNIYLPSDTAKIGPVKIVDWNGVAGTKTLTILPSGSERLNGQTSWPLVGAYGSVVATPIGLGIGYGI